MTKTKTIKAADLFCGAGGTSTGMLNAARKLGLSVDLLAINHWDIAIASHEGNHQSVRHLCQNLDKVDPTELIPGGRLQLLVASPECTHHSNARGGKPRSDQKRADAWLLMRWVEKLYIENILIENVKEFRDWGPLGSNGKPLKRKRGEFYRLFIETLKINYSVEERLLNAANFGDATTRERLFIMARRPQHKKVKWPEASHAAKPYTNGRRTLKPWRTAREVIDWSLPSQSIYDRKKPLSPNTMARIYAGLKKYSGIPFMVGAGGPVGSGAPRTVDQPMGVVMTQNHRALIEPFVVNMKGKDRGMRSVDQPLFSQTAQAGHQYVCEPFIVPHFGERKGQAPRTHSVDCPLPCVTAQGRQSLCEPFLVPTNHGGQHDRARSVERPMPTITAFDAMGLAEPFLVAYHGNHNGRSDGDRRTRSLDEPLPTIDTSNRVGLAEPFLVKFYKGSDAASVDKPMPSVTSNFEHLGLAEPFLVEYYGTAGCESVDEPLNTITARDRCALVEPELIGARLDIRFRMLQPHELAAAMSFPKSYHFTGTRGDRVKQIGNAVPVRLAEALCRSLLEG